MIRLKWEAQPLENVGDRILSRIYRWEMDGGIRVSVMDKGSCRSGYQGSDDEQLKMDMHWKMARSWQARRSEVNLRRVISNFWLRVSHRTTPQGPPLSNTYPSNDGTTTLVCSALCPRMLNDLLVPKSGERKIARTAQGRGERAKK